MRTASVFGTLAAAVPGEYMIGSPLFTKLTLTLQGGRGFVVSAPRNSPGNLYIQSARLNGSPLGAPVITHPQVEAGGVLEFDMGPTPSTWGSACRGTPLPSGR